MSSYFHKDHCWGARPLGPPRPLTGGGFGCCPKKEKAPFEFKYDQRIYNAVPVPIEPVTLPVVEVDLDTVHAGDRVWLSGVIGLNNNNATFDTVVLTITRQSPISGTPVTIYTQSFEISQEGSDDITQVPYSHVDVPLTELFDARYTVRISTFGTGLTLQGQSILTVQRIGRP
jgi:hypothetical protein